MKPIFQQLIIDFHNMEIPNPNKRELVLPELPPSLRKAFVLMGMRRSGKTWFMYQEMHSLLAKGVQKEKIVYINFEDDRLSGLQGKELQSLLDAYFELYPQFIEDKDVHFFLDEIHEVFEWQKFIRRVLDTEKFQLYLTGSSAKMLSKEIATSLRGRTIDREIFPFGFSEFLNKEGVTIPENISTKQKTVILHYLPAFLYFGGFPETVDTTPELHRELLQGYMDSVIYRDIIERHKISNPHLLRAFLKFCLQNPATLISIHKIYQTFKSQGYAVSKNTLYEYMDYFQDAYCLFQVPCFSFSHRKSSQKAKKVYPVDQGLITAFTVKPDFEEASRLETAVFSKLRRQTEEVYYYQTASGKEIDFLIVAIDGTVELYQVTTSLADSKTKEREVSALQQSMNELKVNQGKIITLVEEEIIETKEGTIEVIPAWKFL